MIRQNFKPILGEKEYIERTNSKPIETFIPHQAMDLAELIRRFENGQRLNVHQNFRPMENFTDGSIYEESFDDAAPDDIHDIVDVHNSMLEHEAHKRDFADRQKKKKESAPSQPATPGAQQEEQHPTQLVDPAK